MGKTTTEKSRSEAEALEPGAITGVQQLMTLPDGSDREWITTNSRVIPAD